MENNYLDILENNPQPCFSFDLKGKLDYINIAGKEFLRDWNKSQGILSEKNLAILLYQNNLNLQNIEILACGKYFTFEVKNLENNSYCFFGSNVTFQKNTADTLFDLIADIHEALFLVDTDHLGVIVEVNNTACRFLGYSREELLTMKLSDIVDDFKLKNQVDWNEHTNTVKRSQHEFISQAKFKRKNGEVFPVEFVTSIKRVMEKDYQVTLVRDITQRIKDEKEKEHMKIRMFASAKLSHIGEMSTRVAHEINNPLTVIFGKALILKKRLLADKFEKEKSLSDLEVIDSTVKRMTNVISSLRNISKSIESDNLKKEILEDILRDVLTLYYQKIKNFGVEFEMINEENLIGLFIHGNRSQLAQVFMNLLNNSLDEIIDLDEKWLRIETKVNDREVIFKFMDSGKGIPISVQKNLFEPFFSTKAMGKGTGLGLAVSKSVITAHNGSLFYDTESENTCFIIKLPIFTK